MGHIYAIVNSINQKRYIGSTLHLNQRWNQHHTCLDGGYHDNSHLQSAWNKYGARAFLFIVVEELHAPDKEILAREEYWINEFKSWDRPFGYNLSRFVEGKLRHSEESRRKISTANVGLKRSSEFCRKISERRKGTRLSKATRDKISLATKGRPVSEELRKKRSENAIGERNFNYGKHGILHHNFGRKRTPEEREKISKRLKGRKLSEKHCAAISEREKGMGNPMWGKTHTTEVRARISEANRKRIGWKHTPETLAKMAAARRLFWEKKRDSG